jgi:hypothetical protein
VNAGCSRETLQIIKGKVHPRSGNEVPEEEQRYNSHLKFQIRHFCCVEYKLKYNIKYI